MGWDKKEYVEFSHRIALLIFISTQTKCFNVKWKTHTFIKYNAFLQQSSFMEEQSTQIIKVLDFNGEN